MRKLLNIFELIIICILFIGGIVTNDWNYCYTSTLFLIITIINDIYSELKNKNKE